jgi:hypothetical protein
MKATKEKKMTQAIDKQNQRNIDIENMFEAKEGVK